MPLDDTEARVDAMLQKGAGIMREALETYKPIAVFSMFSGGNDSIVPTHFGWENYRAPAVHINTGIGVQKSKVHMREVCSKFGWELIELFAKPQGPPKFMYGEQPDGNRKKVPFDPEKVLHAGRWVECETAYEEAVVNYGFPGPVQHGRMYQRLKERPLKSLVASVKENKASRRDDCVLLISGIRHDESAIRAGYKSAIQKDGGTLWVNPFYFNTAEDFEAYRQEFGLPRNPVSKQIGISGECLCGAFAKDREIELIRKVEPETADYIAGLQERVQANGFPWGWGERPPTWFTAQQRDIKSGQMHLFDNGPEFQPMCVGCPQRRLKRA